MNKKLGNRGFTLIEIIIVIALLGVLSMVAVAFSTSALWRGRNSRRMTDMEQMRSSLEAYRADHVTTGYPPTGTLDTELEDYMKEIPKDPQDNPYSYTRSTPYVYCLCSVMEGTTADYPTTQCAPPAGYHYCVSNN